MADVDRLLACVRQNPINVAILDRLDDLGAPDCWLTAGALFQTVWNVVCGREPTRGIRDYDVFYFDAADRSYAAEDVVVRRAAALFADLDAVVEVRNEARVHLWYEQKFGVAARPFTSSTDAIDHFAATACCVGVRRGADGQWQVHAPHGLDDLFALRLRPNPVLAPREVYEAKAHRWRTEWPSLQVEPWPGSG